MGGGSYLTSLLFFSHLDAANPVQMQKYAHTHKKK